MQEQPCGLELGRKVGDAEAERLEICKPRTELPTFTHILRGAVETKLRTANRAGRDIESTTIKSRHGNTEPLALLANPIVHRHPAIFEHDHGGGLRLPTELLLWGAERESGRAGFHDNARNALRSWLTCAHHADVEVRDSAARYKGLGAVDEIGVAAALDTRRQARRIRSRPRLGQAVARKMLHTAKFRQKSLPLHRRPEGIDHPGGHIVDREISGGRRTALGEFLEDDRGVEPRECRAADVVLDADPAEPECRGLAQCLDREYFVFIPRARKRHHALARKIPRQRLEGALLFGQLEIHGGPPGWLNGPPPPVVLP